MSHFTVIVDTTDSSLEEQLEPFDENGEVEPYMEDCYCSKHNLNVKVNQELARLFGGSFDEVKRTPYNAMDKSVQPDWKEWIADWVAKEKELEVKLEEFRKPDPKCEDCNGTGKRQTTYNPDSKWDWYSIGGRWAGYFIVKKGVTEERGAPSLLMEGFNYEAGEADIVLKKDIDMKAMKKKQKEQAEKNWEHRDDPFSSISNKLTKEQYIKQETSRHPLTPFAFVDKNGEWHESASMGWWGMTSDDKETDLWEKEFVEWFESLPEDTELTLVDCHI